VQPFRRVKCQSLELGQVRPLFTQRGDDGEVPPVPVVPVRAGLPPYRGPVIDWPPGWKGLWSRKHSLPPSRPDLGVPALPGDAQCCTPE
jgi:hypothetical protein